MERLDKILAHLNYGSRKQVKEYIRKGYFMVNGETIYDDDFKVNPVDDEITFDGMTIEYSDQVYFMLNKPQDVVSATWDTRYKTVVDLLEEHAKQGIFPVGRLDIDTTGLLIMTNDGKLAHRLLSPKYHVWKTYEASFSGEFKEEYYEKFTKGITLDDGYLCLPAKVKLISDNIAHISIHEGKYHQVKRMFGALNMEVLTLKRISFGPLVLDENLELGSYRPLTDAEISLLQNEEV